MNIKYLILTKVSHEYNIMNKRLKKDGINHSFILSTYRNKFQNYLLKKKKKGIAEMHLFLNNVL